MAKIPSRKFSTAKKKIASRKFPKSQSKIVSRGFAKGTAKIASRGFAKAPAKAKPTASVRLDRPTDEKARQDRLNELIGHATAWLEEGELSPYDVGFRLNGVLMSTIALNKSEKYSTPIEAFKAMHVIQPAQEGEDA